MTPFKMILHPTDFSGPSEFALGLACGLARDHGAHLFILHVLPPGTVVTVADDLAELRRAEHYEEDLKSYREATAEKLQRLPLPGLPVRAERVLKEGDPAVEILRTANELGCDLIVMGTHGWTGEARRLMGSVAEAVSAKAPCPVVTVEVPFRARNTVETPEVEEAGVLL